MASWLACGRGSETKSPAGAGPYEMTLNKPYCRLRRQNKAATPKAASDTVDGSGITLNVGTSKITFWLSPVLELITAKEPTLVALASRLPLKKAAKPPPRFVTEPE